jgi:hypothetical protein
LVVLAAETTGWLIDVAAAMFTMLAEVLWRAPW